MKNMEKITFENEIYYIKDGKVYDENFSETPLNISTKILDIYYSKIDYTSLSENDLLEYLKNLKTSNYHYRCAEIIEYGLAKFPSSDHYKKIVFPMITSCYRAMSQPQKAIDFWMENKQLFSSSLSVPLLTSLAAAYCDVKNYKLAKMCADKAYAIQGGGTGYKNELSLVYKRIQKEAPYLHGLD